MTRIVPMLLVAALWAAPFAVAAQTARDDSFRSFLEGLWPQAKARGVTQATFDLAFNGLRPDPEVMALTRREPEYGKPVGEYLASSVSPARISGGLQKQAQWARTLADVEQAFGVDPSILLAIWGMETGYGGFQGGKDVIRSLATLAHARYRDDFFRSELLSALLILQQGHIARDRMVGSWAGAMGQPQFIPSSFMTWAVDFSGDGRRDIWTNVPDVLASIANYFRKNGWQPGLPWGFEVVVPRNFDFRQSRGSFRDWTALGFQRADGGALPDRHDAYLLFPSGARGPAFLVTENFVAIKRYNNSDVYALAVGHLADRLHGGRPIAGRWPDSDPQLSRADRMRIQRKLAELGYKVSDFHGRIDFDQRDAIRDLQAKAGMRPDGHPGPEFLERLLPRNNARNP